MQPRLTFTLAVSALLAVSAATLVTIHLRTASKQHTLRQQADAGLAQAQLQLGEQYLDADNPGEAVHWLGLAARQKNTAALDRLGVMAYHLHSKTSPTAQERQLLQTVEQLLESQRQPQTVLQVYQQRAEQGDTEVLLSLGSMYRRGEGVAQDYAEARRYYARYAAAKNARYPGNGEYYLGFIYLEGQGVPVSESRALALFSQSCDAGFRLSCYQLGELYYQGGKTFAKDYKKATALLDVYTVGSHSDSRALRQLPALFDMYQQGGNGIAKNPERIRAIARQLCPRGDLSGESCQG